MKLFLTCLFAGYSSLALSQTTLPLYEGNIPNSKPFADREHAETDQNGVLRISEVSNPTITAYLPEQGKATGAAIIICPGGAYHILAASHEGSDVALLLRNRGIAAFVLKYRLPSDSTMINKEIGPLQDAQRAIQLVRLNAAKWGIDKKRVGIMGFSAGGHLASTAGTHFNQAYITPVKKISLRPDFMILVYPVINLSDSLTHMGSRNNLLGTNPSAEKINEFSNNLHVTKKTPPTFLVHAEDDNAVKVQNTLVFATALQEHKVPFDFYLYEKGGHGFGLNNKTSDVKWLDLVYEWMEKNGWLKK